MKENPSSSQHSFPYFSPQKAQHQKYTATISTPENLQNNSYSNYSPYVNSPSQLTNGN